MNELFLVSFTLKTSYYLGDTTKKEMFQLVEASNEDEACEILEYHYDSRSSSYIVDYSVNVHCCNRVIKKQNG